MASISVIVELFDATPTAQTLIALGHARRVATALGAPLSTLVVTPLSPDGVAADRLITLLSQRGADRIVLIAGKQFSAPMTVDVHGHALALRILEDGPRLVVLPESRFGRLFGAFSAARLTRDSQPLWADFIDSVNFNVSPEHVTLYSHGRPQIELAKHPYPLFVTAAMPTGDEWASHTAQLDAGWDIETPTIEASGPPPTAVDHEPELGDEEAELIVVAASAPDKTAPNTEAFRSGVVAVWVSVPDPSWPQGLASDRAAIEFAMQLVGGGLMSSIAIVEPVISAPTERYAEYADRCEFQPVLLSGYDDRRDMAVAHALCYSASSHPFDLVIAAEASPIAPAALAAAALGGKQAALGATKLVACDGEVVAWSASLDDGAKVLLHSGDAVLVSSSSPLDDPDDLIKTHRVASLSAKAQG